VGNVAHHLIKWVGFLCELCILPMLYSAALLAPVPFNTLRIGIIGSLALVTCALAYYSGSRFKPPTDKKRLRLTQIMVKPPFVVWITAVAIIMAQLMDGLYMLYLVNKK
jgi:hypothetical protein